MTHPLTPLLPCAAGPQTQSATPPTKPARASQAMAPAPMPPPPLPAYTMPLPAATTLWLPCSTSKPIHNQPESAQSCLLKAQGLSCSLPFSHSLPQLPLTTVPHRFSLLTPLYSWLASVRLLPGQPDSELLLFRLLKFQLPFHLPKVNFKLLD